ncbi:MAG: hypothetical protein BroJett030_07590 [Alphaproteobacteria bacterium]|nr:MAG: hypothetical protein BroJett030_07590 [Alphaproteobacteria bacterium]
MTALLDRLDLRLAPLGAEPVKMFGGTCFMLNGNMALGTSRRGLLVRVGPDNDAAAAARPNASRMVMGERVAAGYWFVDEGSLADPAEFEFWVELALAFNRTLPAKSRKATRKKQHQPPARA